MKNLLFFILLTSGVHATATLRIVCGTQELLVGEVCSDRISDNQYFKAEFYQDGSSNFANGRITSRLTPSVQYEVEAVDNWVNLSISKRNDELTTVSSASGYFEKEGDKIFARYSESKSSDQNSCELRRYDMVCIYTEKDLDFK